MSHPSLVEELRLTFTRLVWDAPSRRPWRRRCSANTLNQNERNAVGLEARSGAACVAQKLRKRAQWAAGDRTHVVGDDVLVAGGKHGVEPGHVVGKPGRHTRRFQCGA